MSLQYNINEKTKVALREVEEMKAENKCICVF